MAEGENEMRKKLMDLVQQRSDIESEIVRALDELKKMNIGMDEPLVDSEGYPRNDIDICAVRTLRQLIICKRNDCKDITRQIEEGLHTLHSEIDQNPVSTSILRKPFAKVDVVDSGSPAEKANLKAGDLLTKFATITKENFKNINGLAAVVGENVQKPIRVNVLRNNSNVPLILTPEEWSGPGYLGCKIIPL